jgi:hypothetical protein
MDQHAPSLPMDCVDLLAAFASAEVRIMPWDTMTVRARRRISTSCSIPLPRTSVAPVVLA